MKRYRVILKEGEALEFDGARLDRDGQGVHIYDPEDNTVATFGLDVVTSAYEIPRPDG